MGITEPARGMEGHGHRQVVTVPAGASYGRNEDCYATKVAPGRMLTRSPSDTLRKFSVWSSF